LPERFTDQNLRFCSFRALGATFRRVKLRLPTTLEGPGAINIGQNDMAPKNLNASEPQIEISRRWKESININCPYSRLQKQQKVTQQQKYVVAGKNLPYGIIIVSYYCFLFMIII
jgi:hypothetical protein